MQIEASAPGKLVLIGEYAVLDGAPAVVLGVDRRAHVILEPCEGDQIRIDAPDIGITDARCKMGRHGVKWVDREHGAANMLRLPTMVINAMGGLSGLAPFRAVLDTQAFFLDDSHLKLGLGSSAALTVALAGAIAAHAGREKPTVQELIAMHRGFQHGHGSGLDIATSARGGALIFRMHSSAPRIAPVRLPESLQWCCVWSGRPADTAVLLRRMSTWQARAPASYGLLMRDLRLCAGAAIQAIKAGDVPALLQTITEYATGLRKLGDSSGVDIVTSEHQAIADCAAACGVVYKPCGAGGGDVGIAVSDDSGRLGAFRTAITQAGFRQIELKLDRRGLRVKGYGDDGHRRIEQPAAAGPSQSFAHAGVLQTVCS